MKESLKLAVEKAKRGESEGFGTIYRETCADVYFRARLMMGNRGEARELVRQIYLVVFRTISTLQDPAKMEKWLYTVLYKLGERECQKKERNDSGERKDSAFLGGDSALRRRQRSGSRSSGF